MIIRKSGCWRLNSLCRSFQQHDVQHRIKNEFCDNSQELEKVYPIYAAVKAVALDPSQYEFQFQFNLQYTELAEHQESNHCGNLYFKSLLEIL